jgi:hypothetical protein
MVWIDLKIKFEKRHDSSNWRNDTEHCLRIPVPVQLNKHQLEE